MTSKMTDDAGTLEPVKFEQKLDLRLNELRQDNLFCDVRFEINGRIFPCHRIVLVAVSSYFHTMFNGNFKESGSDIIPLKEIEAETFEEILNAIYTSNIRLLPSNAYSILKASHLFMLKAVEIACTSYILRNKKSVHYLVEICLFAYNIQEYPLYYGCLQTISNDLINYGQTEWFTQISLDIFESILNRWYPKSYEEEFTVLLISKWCKENGSKREDCQKLLTSSRLQTMRFMNPILMSRFTMFSDDATCIEMKNQITADMNLNVHLDLNLYLNVIDVKTGQKGWGVLKVNDDFDTYMLSSYHYTNSSYKTVCKVGSKMYCFEYFDGEREKNVFSCYDEKNDKILLSTPKQLLRSYQMASAGTSIYFMAVENNYFIVWVYDYVLKNWMKLLRKGDTPRYFAVSGYTFLNGFFYIVVTMDKTSKYDSLFSINSSTLVIKDFENIDLLNSDGKGYMLYGFENKLALFNRRFEELSFEVFDLEAEKWLYEDFDMNFGRVKFCLIHHNGFLYVIENNREIVNEKFELKTEISKQIPSLPKRITLGSANNAKVLGTGSVFGADSEATKN